MCFIKTIVFLNECNRVDLQKNFKGIDSKHSTCRFSRLHKNVFCLNTNNYA